MDNCNEPVELFLVANKIDLINEREISKESARKNLMDDPSLRAKDEVSPEDELMKEKSRQDIYKHDSTQTFLGKQYHEVSAKDPDVVN